MNCGSCGLRDPTEKYEELDLTSISPKRWLHVGNDALERLRATPSMTMLRLGGAAADVAYEEVEVHRSLLHTMAEVDGHHYHVVPEAVFGGSKVMLCPRCRRGFDGSAYGERRERCEVVPSSSSNGGGRVEEEEGEEGVPSPVADDGTITRDDNPPTIDGFDDLYCKNAPPSSIAAGADFGRLSGLAALGIATDVSTLERLVLAEARCHHVVFKVVAYGNETDRQRLHGHSIVCPQRAEWIDGGVRERALNGLRLLQHDKAGLETVSQLSTDEYLHGWERGYDEATGLWDDALAARAMQRLRDARTAAKRVAEEAKAEAKRKEAADRAAAAAARRTQPAAQPASQSAAKRTQPPTPATKHAAKKQRTCHDCGLPGHYRNSPKCPNRLTRG